MIPFPSAANQMMEKALAPRRSVFLYSSQKSVSPSQQPDRSPGDRNRRQGCLGDLKSTDVYKIIPATYNFFFQSRPRFGVLSAVIPEKFCSNQLNFCNDTFIKASICVFFASSGFTV